MTQLRNSNETVTELTESAQGQITAENTNKEDSNYKFLKQLKGTPYSIIEKNGIYYGSIGMNIVTEGWQELEVLENDLNIITWDKIVQLCLIIKNDKNV